jgi:hypothetical protein
MFAHSLPYTRKRELLKVVRLLQVFEAPLLWGGKTETELTGTTDIGDIKFMISDSLSQVWENAASIYGDENDLIKSDTTGVIDELLSLIRNLRIALQNDKGERLKIATAYLEKQIFESPQQEKRTVTSFLGKSVATYVANNTKKDPLDQPANKRIVLFEAMRLSFHGSALSDSKTVLLKIISIAYDIDDESFNELLAQAIALNKEMKRSINLVLE